MLYQKYILSITKVSQKKFVQKELLNIGNYHKLHNVLIEQNKITFQI